jgi:hypothetical protein
MKHYYYTVDVTDYIIWVQEDDKLDEMYARVSGASHLAMERMVNALNQMEIEG